MKKYFLLLFVFVPRILQAQVSGNASYSRTQPQLEEKALAPQLSDEYATFTVTGLLNAKADHYVAYFSVLQVGETAGQADSLMTRRIRKFKSALKKIGIDSVSFTTDVISFVPKYDVNVITKLFSRSYNEVPDGFELQKNVIIHYQSSRDLDAIVTAAVSAEIYDLVKVDYFLNDVKKQFDQLRQQCLDAMRERTKLYQTVGVNLDVAKKSLAEDFGVVLPQNRYDQYTAVARPSLEALKKTSNVSGKFHVAEFTQSRYYKALPYDAFDLVINPVITEPVVQLTYQLKMRFLINPPEPEHDQSFMFLGPNGQLQRIELKNK